MSADVTRVIDTALLERFLNGRPSNDDILDYSQRMATIMADSFAVKNRLHEESQHRLQFLCLLNIPHEAVLGHIDTSGKELLGQIADFVSLVEYILGNRVRFGYPLGFMELYPYVPGALQAVQVAGF